MFLGPRLSSMSPTANKISGIKTKQNSKLKEQKLGKTTLNDFFLKCLTLDVAFRIPISTQYYILLIDIISSGNHYE